MSILLPITILVHAEINKTSAEYCEKLQTINAHKERSLESYCVPRGGADILINVMIAMTHPLVV